jgi:hypothetical protein
MGAVVRLYRDIRDALDMFPRRGLVRCRRGIHSASSAAPPVPPPPNSVLIVDAKPEQMAAFDRALRKLVPARYDRYGLGCTVDYLDGDGDEGCDIMKPGRPVPDDLEFLVYYFNDKNKPLVQKFDRAQEQVRRQFPNEKLIVTINPYEHRPPDCTGQALQGCAAVSYCPQYGNCSTQRTSCKRCY